VAQLDLFATIQQEIVEQQKQVMEQQVVVSTDKLYYSIKEVAAIYNVNASLLRFWEKEFSQIKLRKNGKGDRLYTKADIELIGTIHYLTKERRFTLEGTREYLSAKKTSSATTEKDLVTELLQLKRFLLEIKEGIN
jgi:DNA-binding transcriptional MerR regulator